MRFFYTPINMKNKQCLIASFAIVAMALLMPSFASAQCGLALKDEVLKEIGQSTYLKDFRVKLENTPAQKKAGGKETFQILLNKGTHYRFNVKADSSLNDQVILKLYDFTKDYGSNYDQSDGTSYEFFDFFCAKTQVYFISISFAEGQLGCAAAILSYVQKYE